MRNIPALPETEWKLYCACVDRLSWQLPHITSLREATREAFVWSEIPMDDIPDYVWRVEEGEVV